MSEFEYPPRLGWCTKHSNTTICKDCEIDLLTKELAEAREEYGMICGECGSVMQLVRPGKHQCQYCEMKEFYSKQLSRYREALERIDETMQRIWRNANLSHERH